MSPFGSFKREMTLEIGTVSMVWLFPVSVFSKAEQSKMTKKKKIQLRMKLETFAELDFFEDFWVTLFFGI